MAVGLDTGVPWVMCKEDDAPDPLVSYLYFWFHPEIGPDLGLFSYSFLVLWKHFWQQKVFENQTETDSCFNV